jgi:crotonobetainyl-CoA:carnitine CoA-transferase CaiB-like acyl-CoA transferase
MAQPLPPDAPGPLARVRVLELCDEKGHYCGKLLADMGADVIKVEPPGGDGARRVGPFVNDIPDLNRSLYFWYYNTNKRGITLSLDTAEGQGLFRELVRSADVVLESYPPGYLDARGLGFQHLSRDHPGLIMTSITPFGQNGPWSSFKTSDLVSLALGGPMASCGYDDLPGSPPIRGNGYQGYNTGSHYACIGTLIALYERDQSGLGQHVDVSIHEANACTTEGAFPNWEYDRRIVRRQTGRHASPTPTYPWQFLCRDGRYVNIIGVLPRSRPSWRKLLDWMEEKGMVEDLREAKYEEVVFVPPGQRDQEEVRHVLDTIARFVSSLTSEEVYRRGQELEWPVGIVRSPEENLDDPHWWDRGFFVKVEHEGLDQPTLYPGAPYRFSRTPWQLRRRAPLLGEHNYEVYVGELGLTKEQLVMLAETGVI